MCLTANNQKTNTTRPKLSVRHALLRLFTWNIVRPNSNKTAMKKIKIFSRSILGVYFLTSSLHFGTCTIDL